jgi:hypothetical protein
MNPKEHLIAAIEQHPTLGRGGFGKTPDEHVRFLASITEIDVRSFVAMCSWLSQCRRTKTIRRHATSYALKHRATNLDDPQGIFLAAVIHLGIPFELTGFPGGSVYLAIGSRLPPDITPRVNERATMTEPVLSSV